MLWTSRLPLGVMMPKLSETISRVSRAVPKTAKVMTLTGKEAHKTFECKCCLGTFLVGEAYLKDRSKRKNDDDTRDICVPCWIEHNGKTFDTLKREKERSDSSLGDFL